MQFSVTKHSSCDFLQYTFWFWSHSKCNQSTTNSLPINIYFYIVIYIYIIVSKCGLYLKINEVFIIVVIHTKTMLWGLNQGLRSPFEKKKKKKKGKKTRQLQILLLKYSLIFSSPPVSQNHRLPVVVKYLLKATDVEMFISRWEIFRHVYYKLSVFFIVVHRNWTE